VTVETPHGPARVHLHPVDRPRAALVLGHGAGGGVTAPDLVAATEAAHAAELSVALVEQPYRVAERRSPAPAHHLDAAWTAVAEDLRADALAGLPLIVGGRSAGARVACRTAGATGAVAVLCLAFPVHPPGRPEKSRLDELDAVTVPTLVVQGDKDPFGMPPDGGPNRTVVRVPGNHSLRSKPAVREAVSAWLPTVVR
jgi:predicted alpha/beta-hydrolase family hydrolase